MSPFEISFDGRPVSVVPGRTIAAALLSAGIRAWPSGTSSAGLYCGIGVCFGCQVTLNGRAGVRACLVEARAGDVVTSVPSRGAGS